MKSIRFTISFAVVFLFSTQAFYAQRTFEKYVNDEVLIKFKQGTSNSVALKTTRDIGSNSVERLGDLRWQRVKLRKSMTIETAIAYYKTFSEVEAVQPNYYYQLAVTPNDTRYSEMYGLGKISAPTAWNTATGSSDTIVAVIDTGIKYTHEDLAANMWTNSGETPDNGIDDDGNGFIDDYYGYDFRYNDSDPDDEFGHGTHVGGTIGAVGNNALGVTGVNWNVRLMAIKIYSASGTDTTSAMLINAYNYVRMMKERGENIRVSNNSYSGCQEACGYDQATKDALDAMGDAGILNVFAAGNDGRDIDAAPAYPASYSSPTVLSVAASNSTDIKAGFSNFGPNHVDLAAPGVGILSTTTHVSKYGNSSGTSMASPHVAGAAALLSSHNPKLSNASLKATLMNNVDALKNWDDVVKTGGRLNVSNALSNQTICDFSLSQSTLDATTKGGLYSLNITSPQNCDYSIKSNDRWIRVLDSIDNYSGNQTITFWVSVNPTISRSGSITIAGQTFTVTQSRL